MLKFKLQTIVTHLLLVDDDEDNLELFTIILEKYHYTVDAYSDPVQALLEFKPNGYDLIILDYRMPKLGGLELYKKIKQIDNSAKIIFLTATLEQLTVSKDSLATIRKPVRADHFLQQIKTALSEAKPEYPITQSPISILNSQSIY